MDIRYAGGIGIREGQRKGEGGGVVPPVFLFILVLCTGVLLLCDGLAEKFPPFFCIKFCLFLCCCLLLLLFVLDLEIRF